MRYGVYTERQRVCLEPGGDGLTQQHFKDSCDANNIVARYNQTGVLDAPRNPATPDQYGYAPSVSFFEALLVHREHQETVARILAEAENPAIPEAGVPADRASEGTTGGPAVAATAKPPDSGG